MKIQASNPHSHHHRSSPRLRLVRLQPSRYLWAIIRIVHFLAICAIWLAGLSLIMQLVLSLLILCSLVYAFCQYAMQPTFRLHYRQESWYLIVEKAPVSTIYNRFRSIFRTRFYGFEDWTVGDQYRLVSWSYCSTFLAVVQIEDKESRQRLLPIVSDCCEQGEFRWLRVVIKYLL